jgi:hypothetical protein
MSEKKDRELSEKELKKAAGGGQPFGTPDSKGGKNPYGTADSKDRPPFGAARGKLDDAAGDGGKQKGR